jgi:hypothetical protein
MKQLQQFREQLNQRRAQLTQELEEVLPRLEQVDDHIADLRKSLELYQRHYDVFASFGNKHIPVENTVSGTLPELGRRELVATCDR